MINNPLPWLRIMTFCLPLALVASCGGGGTGQGPVAAPGSKITVTPEKVDWTVGTAVGCPGTDFHDTYFDIFVKSPSGSPASNVEVRVSLDLAPGTYITTPVMYLYDTADDGITYNVLVTSYPYYTTTNNVGVKTLMVRYELIAGCTYAGNLNVYSGSAYGVANIDAHE